MTEESNPAGEQIPGQEGHGLNWLESLPSSFWAEHPEISKVNAVAAGRAFAKGATTPFVFDIWDQALAFYLLADMELPKEKEVNEFIESRRQISDQFVALTAAGRKREAERFDKRKFGFTG